MLKKKHTSKTTAKEKGGELAPQQKCTTQEGERDAQNKVG